MRNWSAFEEQILLICTELDRGHSPHVRCGTHVTLGAQVKPRAKWFVIKLTIFLRKLQFFTRFPLVNRGNHLKKRGYTVGIGSLSVGTQRMWTATNTRAVGP